MHTIFDIACNFTNERFDKDLNDVISRSFDNNITKFGLICSQLKDVQKIIKIKDLYPDSICLLYTSPSPRDRTRSRMPSSA